MTCSKNFGRLLQVGCLGLIGMLTVVGCGGSENRPTADTGVSGEVGVLTKPNLTASSATVTVGSVDVGKVSTPAPVTITNNGTAAGALTVTPSGVGIAASGCTGNLAINTPCTLSITATPSAAGSISGSVTVAAAGGNTLTIGVTGTAVVQGNFTVSPTAIALGDMAIGDTKQATVVVTANAALTGLTTSVLGGDLKVDASSTCTGTLTAGQSCNVVVNFSSATAGSPTSDAVVVAQGGVTRSVPVTANVLPPAKLAATPLAGSLTAVPGSASVSNLDINVGNIGGMATGTLAVAIVGADFKVVSEDCSIVTLASSKFCTVTVQYTPAATVTAVETASLTITDKGLGASVATVALTGTPTPATPPSTLTLTGATTALGSVAPGASGAEVLFTVTNTSATPSGALTAALVPSASITISSNACAAKATLALNETCTIGLKLTPAAGATPQPVQAVLTVTGAAAKNPVSITVTGAIVTGGTLSATPTSVNFSSIPVNQTSAVQSVTIKNTGATATGVLSVTLSGTGAAQVAVTGNTCTGTLASAATCTVAVQFSPTDTTGVVGTITVTDGTASAAIPMAGTGLVPGQLTVTDSGLIIAISDKPFGNAVKGYASSPIPVDVRASITVTTDTGAITAAITGTNAADFAVSKNGCTVALQPQATCPLELTFTPGDVGARSAILTVTGSKGGSWTVQLTGTGLPLVQLIAMGAVSTGATPVTGLDFGMQPNGTPSANKLKYRIVVRGASPATATSTVDTIALVTGTTPDFRYVDSTGAVLASNPCNSATLALPPATHASPWSILAPTEKDPGLSSTTPVDDQATSGFYTCDFFVQFYPQTGKSATPKTAKLNASATGGGTDSLTLTGIASGPLTITPTAPTISTPVELGGSSTTTLFTVVNNGAAGVTQGNLTVALGGTNAGEFGIVADACSTHAALIRNVSTSATPTAGSSCTVGVVFAPTSVGAKTATLTVTAGSSGETATATITATGGQALPITVTPTATAPASVAFDPVAQANVGAWKTFTIANPAGALLTGTITYAVTGAYQLYTLATAGVSTYPAGSCGDTNTKQLNPGESCTIQIRLVPVNTVLPSAIVGTLAVQDQDSTPLPGILLKGTSTSQIVLSGSPITLVGGVQTVDFGSVATGVALAKTVTVTNTGAANTAGGVTLTISLLSVSADYSVAQTSTCVPNLALAGGGTCQLVLNYTGVAPVTEPAGSIFVGNGSSTTDRAELALAAKSVSPALLALYGFGDYVPNATFPTAGQGIDLGSANLSTPSGVLTLWFTNTGDVAATGLNSSMVQTGGGTEFAVVAENQGTCFSIGGTLAPDATCSVNVQFTPTGTIGNRTAVFSLFATSVSAVPVNLQATAIQTTNSVFVVAKGGTNSFYNFATTSSLSANGTKAYFVLQNNLPGGANIAANTLNLGSAADFTGGTVDIAKVSSIGDPLVFLLTKETDSTGVACGATLAPASSCTFAVAFKPTSYADATRYRWAAVALLNHTNPTLGGGHGNGNLLGVIGRVEKPAKLQLSATLAGVATVAPGTADFGQILQGQLTPLTFTITNTGDVATAGAVQAVIAGTGSHGAYALVTASTCGTAALPSLGTCTATVTPQLTSTVGSQTGQTVQATGATSEASPTVALTATVVNAATLVLAPSGTSFTDTVVGGTALLTITVTNGSTTDVNGTRQNSGVLAVTLSNSTDFTVGTAGSTCLTSTGAYRALPGKTATLDNTCEIVVVFSPLTAGAKTLAVTVAGTPGGTVQTGSLTAKGLVDLAFTGANAAGTAAAPVVLGAGSFVVSNVGALATGVLRESIAGANASVFVITSDTCYGNALPAGQTCTVVVSFIGTSSTVTAQTASLTVTDGTANNTLVAYAKVGGP